LTPRAVTLTFRTMFIRKTTTRNKSATESYFTFRLVASERTGNQVRQITLLNLGRHFDLPQPDWPRLCARIDALLAGQPGMLPEPEAVEVLAERFAARLIVAQPAPGEPAAAAPPAAPEPAQPAPTAPSVASTTPAPIYAEVDVASLQLTRPRAVGVEAAGLAAMDWLGIDPVLTGLGLNGVQRDAVAGLLIGRMAAPGNEMATWRWLRERSALGELLDVDFEAMPPIRLYRTSDLLVRHRDKIEAALFTNIQGLFGLPVTVTLYDLTNTYFEGTAAGNAKAARGRSKEKRGACPRALDPGDCPLVTLGLVLDSSGFVRRSKMFAGNAAEAGTLQGMLKGLATPAGALIIMDAGIATEANIAWLKEQKYRYLVVSRERGRQFDPGQAVDTLTASNETIRLQRVLSEDGAEVRLYCHSEGRTRPRKPRSPRASCDTLRGRSGETRRRSEQTARTEEAGGYPAADRPVERKEPGRQPALRHRRDLGRDRREGRFRHLDENAGRGLDADPSRGLLPA
jgi:hypothetical protein